MFTFYSYCQIDENKKNKVDTNPKGLDCLHPKNIFAVYSYFKIYGSCCKTANRIAIIM